MFAMVTKLPERRCTSSKIRERKRERERERERERGEEGGRRGGEGKRLI